MSLSVCWPYWQPASMPFARVVHSGLDSSPPRTLIGPKLAYVMDEEKKRVEKEYPVGMEMACTAQSN